MKSVPQEVKDLIGKDISLIGFLIPNDGSSINDISEFLLTPISGGCVHVPPPPPNYIVHVTMPPGKSTRMRFGAVEVHGRLTLPKLEGRKYYSFELLAQSVDSYDPSMYMNY